MKPRLTYPAWDDLIIPAIGINPAGTAGAATFDTNEGTLVFAKGSTAACQFQMPHEWKQGSDIYLHIHWHKTSNDAGTVNWQIKYEWTNIGAVRAGFTSLTKLTSVIASDATGKHGISTHPVISGAGKTLSSIICVFLQRVNDGDDTYANDAKLLGIDIHYQKDSLGSHFEYTKL